MILSSQGRNPGLSILAFPAVSSELSDQASRIPPTRRERDTYVCITGFIGENCTYGCWGAVY